MTNPSFEKIFQVAQFISDDLPKRILESQGIFEKELSTSDVKTKLLDTLPYLSKIQGQTLDERVEILTKELRGKNADFITEIKGKIESLSLILADNKSLIEDYSKITQTTDLSSLLEWYTLALDHVRKVNKTLSGILKKAISKKYDVFVYLELSPVNLDRVGFIGSIYDDETKTGVLEDESNVLVYDHGFKVGRNQSIYENQIVEVFYENDRVRWGYSYSEESQVIFTRDCVYHRMLLTDLEGQYLVYKILEDKCEDDKTHGWNFESPHYKKEYGERLKNGRYEHGVLKELSYNKWWFW
jgi:hypothetical protein